MVIGMDLYKSEILYYREEYVCFLENEERKLRFENSILNLVSRDEN